VPSLAVGPRVAEAMERSIRWLDRCIAYHERSGQKETQSLFAIIQGGLEPDLRDRCLDEMIKRKDGVGGYAIGGLSGGEEKGNIFPLKHSRPPDSHLLRRFLADVSQFPRVSYPPNVWHDVESNNVPTNYPKIVSSKKCKWPCVFIQISIEPRYSMGIGFAEGLHIAETHEASLIYP